MNNKKIVIFYVIILVYVFSCSKNDPVVEPITDSKIKLTLPNTPFDYGSSDYPQHLLDALREHDNTPFDNQITNHGATLGRVLFYDKKLSLNNTVSCASCHHQDKAFTDGVNKSVGFNGQLTKRNSMSLINLRMYDREKMFWDERTINLEEQVLHPIQDEIEMGLTISQLIVKLENTDYYPDLFQNAFGDNTISSDRISKALSQFLRSIVSYNSKYDKVISGTASFNSSESNGQILYNTIGTQQGCISCHGGDFIDQHSYNFQIAQTPSRIGPHDYSDLGIYEATGNSSDSSRFKVSSLRNIELTAPYLHDGSIPDLLSLFGNGSEHNFGMNSNEVNDLIAFLKTLTDDSITNDEKFSSPFDE